MQLSVQSRVENSSCYDVKQQHHARCNENIKQRASCHVGAELVSLIQRVSPIFNSIRDYRENVSYLHHIDPDDYLEIIGWDSVAENIRDA